MERTLRSIVRAGAGLCLACALAGAQAPGTLEDLTSGSQDPAASGPATMLRLRSGGILWARIEGHDPQVLVVRRLDNGGLARLPWGLLDAAQEQEMRTRYGYVDLSTEEPMTDGQRLVMYDGTELIGKITAVDDKTFVLKTDEGPRLISKGLVRSATDTQVAALEVFTKQELYSQELAKLADEADPEAHYELAQFCERILDFQDALVHYRLAAELDPEFKPAEMAAILARVEEKVAQQEQLDALAAIDRLKRRARYQDALDALVAFDGAYPDTPLRVDRLKLEERVLKERARDVKELVRRSWYSWMERLIANAAREQTFEGALAYVDDGLREEIAEKVTGDARRIWPDVEVDQVRQMWIERDPGRWKAASYGLGTWLLGEEDALKGGPAAKPEEKPEGNQRDARRADLEEKMARFLKNQRIAKGNRKSEEDEQEIQDFWGTLSVLTQRAWLVAYYAENGGDMDLRPQPELHNCQSCGGTGAREVVYTGSARSDSGSAGLKLEECPTCHGIGRVRRIRYR